MMRRIRPGVAWIRALLVCSSVLATLPVAAAEPVVDLFGHDAAWLALAYLQSFAFPRIPPARYPDKVLAFVKRFSRDADAQVQYFLSFEAPETHIWVLADGGRIVRAYGFSGERGEVIFSVGQLTRAERDLQMIYAPSSEELFENGFDKMPRSRDLLSLAARWSVNPSAMNPHYATEKGWIATLRTRSSR
jgi:hypothetical protein